MAITWLKMENICIFSNVIKKISQNKMTKLKVKNMRPFYPFQVPNGIGTIM